MTSEFYDRRVVVEVECQICGKRWVPRVAHPKECPACTSYDWNKLRDKKGEPVHESD